MDWRKASLILELNANSTKKETHFFKRWDDKIEKLERTMSERYGNLKTKEVLQYWRKYDSLINDLYFYLLNYFPVPIPHVLFFSSKEIGGQYGSDLADKWLKDIFTGESFYKRNKEYFTRAEVKYFLSCDWHDPVYCDYDDLVDYFFNTKIKANDLNLSLNIFRPFRDCFAHQIVIEYFKFLCNNKRYIKEDEIREIIIFLRYEYISTGINIDFNNHTYHSLKRFHYECFLRKRFGHRYDHKIVQDYFLFICKNMKRVRDEKEIRDICDFLNARINNEQNFNFENMTWQELKRLSDEWHTELARERDELAGERDDYYRKKEEENLNAEWKKSSIKDFGYEKDGKTWTIKEITKGKSLYEEGKAMQHCVFSYVDRCIQGDCHIFSVSCKSGEENDEEKIATLEISRDKRLEQAGGQSNARIDNETADIIKIWADKNQINCGAELFKRRQFYVQVA